MPGGHHEHCDKCYSVHCQVLSCIVIKCRKNCGAILHMCKQEEHQLLCPNETVPCLNALYGCPLNMLRHRLAKHLEVCPASMVCCSQEWNRWPASETDMIFCKNISENPQTEENLDVAMALRDQDLLFRSIKMKNIFPELIIEEPTHQDISAGVNSHGKLRENCTMMEEKELSQEEREALAESQNVCNNQNYSSWEKIFKKEMDGCKQTVKILDKIEERGKEKKEEESSSCQGETRSTHLSQEIAAAAPSIIGGATGFAPWEEGEIGRAHV